MFALLKMLIAASFVGLVTSLLFIGAVGLWLGVPLTFLELLPGDDLIRLQKFPRSLLLAGCGGFAVGTLGGFASQLSGQRINAVISTLLVGLCAVMTIRVTHPGVNLSLESGWIDYLESYRLTLLAALAGTVGVAVLGWMLKPFKREKNSA